MPKAIVLGMNRTGTKLASFIVSKSLSLPTVFLEPFTWDTGLDASLSDNWTPQQKLRKRSAKAKIEHESLKIISDKSDESHWLETLLYNPAWDVIKFIEIGRYELYYKYSPEAYYILLIRNPIDFLSSIRGMAAAREAVTEQWGRLHKVENFKDPLPDAEIYLNDDIADCARAYHTLYSNLSNFNPKHGVKVDYTDLINGKLDLTPLEKLLGRKSQHIEALPTLGASTKSNLTHTEIDYIKLNLGPIYKGFLKDK